MLGRSGDQPKLTQLMCGTRIQTQGHVASWLVFASIPPPAGLERQFTLYQDYKQ